MQVNQLLNQITLTTTLLLGLFCDSQLQSDFVQRRNARSVQFRRQNQRSRRCIANPQFVFKLVLLCLSSCVSQMCIGGLEQNNTTIRVGKRTAGSRCNIEIADCVAETEPTVRFCVEQNTVIILRFALLLCNPSCP